MMNTSGAVSMTNALPLASTRMHNDQALGQYQENFTSPLQSQPPSIFSFSISQQTPPNNNTNTNNNNNNSNRFDFPVDGRNHANAYNIFADVNSITYNENSRNKFSNNNNNNNNNISSGSNGNNNFNNVSYQFNANVLTNSQVMMSNNSNNNNNVNNNVNGNNYSNSSMSVKQDYTQSSSNSTAGRKMTNGEIDTTCQDITNLPNTDDAGVLKYANKHLTSTFDIGANDLQSLEQLKEMIMALQDVTEGKVDIN